MTTEETVQMFNAIDTEDTEMAHGQADELLLRFLTENGYQEIVDAWTRTNNKCGGFWYA